MVSVMRAKRIYCVVVYDIVDDNRRTRIARLFEPYGTRINRSVYECMFTKSQLEKLQNVIEGMVREEDQVAIYPICIDCYARIRYIPSMDRNFHTVHIFK